MEMSVSVFCVMNNSVFRDVVHCSTQQFPDALKERLASIYFQVTRCHIPEDNSLHSQCHKNLTSFLLNRVSEVLLLVFLTCQRRLKILTYRAHTKHQTNQKKHCWYVKVYVTENYCWSLKIKNSFWILTISLLTKASSTWHGEKEINVSHHVLYACRWP